jgi:hypothetical protein
MRKNAAMKMFAAFLVLMLNGSAISMAATPADPTTGTISGHVFDSRDGSVVPMANVSTDPPTSSVTTDVQGFYSIPDVLPGVYTVIAAKYGYPRASVSISVGAGRTTTADVHLGAGLANTVTNSPLSLTSGLVAHFPFDGSADDSSGNGNDGVVYGATLVEDRGGTPDHAYYFGGSSTYIEVPSSASLAEMGDAMSIVAWIKIDEQADYAVDYDYRHIVAKGATFGDRWADYALGLDADGGLLWENSSNDNAPARLNTQPPISKGVWHHLAVTFNHGTISTYVDGDLQEVVSGPYELIRSSSEPLYIGCRYESPFIGAFWGAIDDILIYDRVLSASEVQILYESD